MSVNDGSTASHQFVALPLAGGVGLTTRGLNKLAFACVAAGVVAIAPAMCSRRCTRRFTSNRAPVQRSSWGGCLAFLLSFLWVSSPSAGVAAERTAFAGRAMA